jgi:hypothetical protein
MPLVGNLSEFPLPEVLLLIGSRTGRLRLYDAPEFIPMEVDLSEGQAHGLHIGEALLTTTAQIVAELSLLVEMGEGMFEFSAEPIVSIQRDEPLSISELVMLLVLHVDEKLAKQNALLAPRQLLAGGVRAEDLAEYLGLEETIVRLSLDSLHQLGIVKLLETSDVESLRGMMLEQEIADKSNEFQMAVEASDLIRRTGKLLKLPSVK